MKKLLLFAPLLLGSCGMSYEHTYRVLLDDGTTSTVYTRYPYQPGEHINADLLGSTNLQEYAKGTVRATIVSEVKP